jgi:WD40 repeat protein
VQDHTPTVDIDGRAQTFAPPEVPARLGKYQIVRELGRGGMGVVYLARDPIVGRNVALKMILSAQFADADNWARFVVEARALAQLEHPYIVRLYDFGSEDGKPYFALEHVEGGSLKERTRQQPFSPQAAALLVKQLAQAIDFAHQKGIIHRDLKPTNVLFDAAGDPKIVDFGLAKLPGNDAAATAGSPDALTRTGDILGTPQYMAPEQAQGVRGIVGPPADIYALGAILYELLTRRPPFDAADSVQSLLAVMTREPAAPRRLNPTVPRELETICLKCLRKEPVNRYASAADLAADLGRFLAGEAIRARSPGTLEQVQRWARRNPAVAALLFLIAVIAALGFAGVSWQWQRAEARAEAEAEARREAKRLQEKADRARAEAETALYFSRILQAQYEVEANHVPAARRLLELCRPAPGATDRRSWEWHYLQRLCHAELQTYRAEGGWAWDAVWSPDGHVLAVSAGLPYGDPARNPGWVILWDVATGRKLKDLRGHRGSVQRAIYSPDGQAVLTLSIDGSARLWDVATGKERWQVRCRVVGFSAGPAFFTPDGKEVIVAGPENCSLRVNTATGKEAALDGQVMGITSSGSVALYRAKEKACFYLNGTTGVAEAQVPLEGDGPWCVSPDGRTVATVGKHSVLLRDLTDRPARELPLPPGPVYSIAFSPDAAWLATAGADKVVRVWDLATSKVVREYRGHVATIRGVSFDPDGTSLASADQMGEVKIWDLTRDPSRYRLATVNLYCEALGPIAFSQKGDRPELFVDNASTLESWDVLAERRREGHRVPMLGGAIFPRYDRALSADGRWIAAAGEDSTRVHLWDAATGKERFTLAGHTIPVRTVALSSDGKWLASAGFKLESQGGKARLTAAEAKCWSTSTERAVATLPPGAYTCLAVSADGRHIAGSDAAGPDAMIQARLWDAQTGRELWNQPAHRGQLAALAFSQDGVYLASAGFADSLVRVWETETGHEVAFPQPLRGDPSLTSVMFTPDGKRLAAVGYDGNVSLWDLASGTEVITIRCAAGPRPDDRGFSPKVVFSPDGGLLASNDWSGDISIWDGRNWPENSTAETDRESARRAREWHQTQAEEHQKAGRTFAAAFHRDRLR